ncbi:MAG TPA: glycosyltransferase family 2 protein [Solirubrobacteraceae bacterium]|nr:glycosyltransferase family 2 protein [Solirubrobacteraceae bacterium]
MTSSVDVVIPVHNRFALTESCLRHLQAQTVPHRVVVVDNGSTDGTSELLREQWPEVNVVTCEQPLGFAEACNRGAASGSGEVVVLLNNDVDCRPDFLQQLARPLHSDESVGAVAAVMLQPGEQVIDSVGLFADVTLAPFQRLDGLPASRAGDRCPVLLGPAGAAAAYRRRAWDEVGGLDEEMFAYMEDFDLALRLRAAGWQAVVAPDAVGVHLGSATHGRRSASQRRLFGFGRGYVLRRYGVLRSRHALRTLLTEALVVVGDVLISRDLSALRGRLAGWRAAAALGRRPMPSEEFIDTSISLRRSLGLRGVVHRRGAR